MADAGGSRGRCSDHCLPSSSMTIKGWAGGEMLASSRPSPAIEILYTRSPPPMAGTETHVVFERYLSQAEL